MALETPLTAGVSVDALWEVFPARRVGLTHVGNGQRVEAAQLFGAGNRGVFVVPQSCGPAETTTGVAAQGEDGSDAPMLLTGSCVALAAGD